MKMEPIEEPAEFEVAENQAPLIENVEEDVNDENGDIPADGNGDGDGAANDAEENVVEDNEEDGNIDEMTTADFVANLREMERNLFELANMLNYICLNLSATINIFEQKQ